MYSRDYIFDFWQPLISGFPLKNIPAYCNMENTEFMNESMVNAFMIQILNSTNAGNNSSAVKGDVTPESMNIIQSAIACVGIIANSTVILVFVNHKKLRRKIPNIFIINQVTHSLPINSR